MWTSAFASQSCPTQDVIVMRLPPSRDALRPFQAGGAALLEPARLLVQLVEVGTELLARPLPSPGQAGAIPDSPGPQNRTEDLVAVDPQVVDAGHGDLHRPAG